MSRLTLKMKLGLGLGTLLMIVMLIAGIGYRAAVRTEAVSHAVQFNSTQKDLALAIQLAVSGDGCLSLGLAPPGLLASVGASMGQETV